MRSQIEGSRAIAATVARCRPQVVPAYPITPQTHIVEALGAMTRDGTLPGCQFLTVESEFAAMSAAIGASAVGARAYTATASQGLLYMAEALFNASGLGLPIVLTVANRAIGAPINIWNDQSDAMSQRDCGWVQLYAADNQAAVDLHVTAFALAERLSIPVMVCVDGFVLTHAVEPIDVPGQDEVDAFLPPLRPRQVLDPDDPVAIGAMVGPEAFTEVRYLSHHQLCRARTTFADLAARWVRPVPAVQAYRTEGARTVVLALGSVSGTVKDVADELDGVGVVTLTMFRPFPYPEVRRALEGASRVVVLERAFAPGAGGIVTADVRAALAGEPAPEICTVVAGLGGRAITREALRRLLTAPIEPLTFLDLRRDIVDQEIVRLERGRDDGGGPPALNVLRHSGVPASRIG
ncbi:MAG: pyruvate ferredoxin oxidoreductase [Jatrophihabitans sp.]|nr:MAG: pyruvate ferredoxin oxidoreductase [Jatrophihabitans sp.]